jgi:hypothetical protein
MNRIYGFVVLVLIAFIGIVGLGLTLNAGDALSTNKGDLLFFNRYFTTSRTPIGDIDSLNGISSNVQDQLDAKTSTSLADTKAWVGNSAGLAVAQNISLVNDIVGTMDNSGAINTTVSASTITSAMIVDNTVASDDITNGTITDTDMGWLKEVLVIASGATSNTTAASAVYNGTLLVQPWQNETNAYIINTSLAATGVATVVVNAALGADFQVQVIRTKP